MADLGSVPYRLRVRAPSPVFLEQGGVMVTQQAHNPSIGGSTPLFVSGDYSLIVIVPVFYSPIFGWSPYKAS